MKQNLSSSFWRMIKMPALTMLSAAILVTIITGCSSLSRPALTHVDRPMMNNRAIPVVPGEIPNTVVTTAPLCGNEGLFLPSGTVLEFSYPSPFPYSPWRPVYQLQLPGRETWWPCTAVVSKKGAAYFSYFVIPSRTLDLFRRACPKRPSQCCPNSAPSSPGKNPVRRVR